MPIAPIGTGASYHIENAPKKPDHDAAFIAFPEQKVRFKAYCDFHKMLWSAVVAASQSVREDEEAEREKKMEIARIEQAKANAHPKRRADYDAQLEAPQRELADVRESKTRNKERLALLEAQYRRAGRVKALWSRGLEALDGSIQVVKNNAPKLERRTHQEVVDELDEALVLINVEIKNTARAPVPNDEAKARADAFVENLCPKGTPNVAGLFRPEEVEMRWPNTVHIQTLDNGFTRSIIEPLSLVAWACKEQLRKALHDLIDEQSDVAALSSAARQEKLQTLAGKSLSLQREMAAVVMDGIDTGVIPDVPDTFSDIRALICLPDSFRVED